MPCGMSLQLGWIPVRKKVELGDDVAAEDAIEIAVRLLPILDEAALHELLRQSLEKRGWKRQEDGSLRKDFGEATATLPPGSATVTLRADAAESVAAEGVAEGAAPETGGAKEEQDVEDAARRVAEKKLARAKDAARRSLERRNAEAILAAEPELRAEVASAVNETTKRSLERRAAALGEVESVVEGRGAEGGYELTITVKT